MYRETIDLGLIVDPHCRSWRQRLQSVAHTLMSAAAAVALIGLVACGCLSTGPAPTNNFSLIGDNQ